MKPQTPTIRAETIGKLYKAFDAKKISMTEVNFVCRVFDERDFYAKNPLAKALPGFEERENRMAEIVKSVE